MQRDFEGLPVDIQKEITDKFNNLGLNQVTVRTIHALGYQMLTEKNKGKKINIQEYKYWNILNNDEEVKKELHLYLSKYLEITNSQPDKKQSNIFFEEKDMLYKFKER